MKKTVYKGRVECVDCEKKDTEILELRLQLANEQTGNAELKAKLAKQENTIETQAYDIKIRYESIDKLVNKLATETKRADVAEANERDFRELLWVRHGCPLEWLYWDDGEKQCNHCKIDFKRNSPQEIKYIWKRQAEHQLAQEAGNGMD